MHGIPEPKVRDLLLPLLSCLPVAFLSPKPPEVLLPLLSPILRQRVHLRSSNTIASAVDPSSSTSNWLSLLTWSRAEAGRLVEVCSNLNLEPHPVSGELELFGDDGDEDAGKAYFRRLDHETLQARCDVREHSLSVIWIWSVGDTGSVGLPGENEGGEAQDGWRVADIQPHEDGYGEPLRSTSGWYSSIREAEENYTIHEEAIAAQHSDSADNGNLVPTPGTTSNQSRDEDDYWASYDQTPDQTPTRSPAPRTPANGPTSNLYNPSAARKPSTTLEAEYYARYGSVQPAMDGHDPDEEDGVSDFPSTLRQGRSQQRSEQPPSYNTLEYGNDNNEHGRYRSAEADDPPIVLPAQTIPPRIHSPIPSRPSSSGSEGRSPVEALEASATSSSAAEIGVKQHISTELKSLYRLAKAAGIDRNEFERVVRTELDVLGLMDA